MNPISVSYDLGMIILSIIMYTVIVEDSQTLAAVAAIIAIGHFFHFVATLIDFGLSRTR